MWIKGHLKGLPDGTGGIHIHEGCDVNNAETVGGHFYDSDKCENPWRAVEYSGPDFDMDVYIKGVPWIATLGRVVVIHDESGNRVAITNILPRGPGSTPSDMFFGEGASLRLPPHLAFESWSPAVCQEDYSPIKSCVTAGAPDSCGGVSSTDTSCRSESRHRWCDSQASLVLKVTRDIDPCAEMVVGLRMHNPPFQQLGVHVIISGFGPDMTIEPTQATVQAGMDSVLSSIETPMFTHFSVTELGCTAENDVGISGMDAPQLCDKDSMYKYVDQLTWRGSCAGMYNELVIVLEPNIDLDSGSRITISGLKRSGAPGLEEPEVVTGTDFFEHVGLVDWNHTSGTAVLAILESDCLEPATMKSGIPHKIKLLFEMPTVIDFVSSDQKVRPFASASLPAARPLKSASCTTDGEDMCLLPPAYQDAPVLETRESSQPSFVVRSISQETCDPGACSDLTLSFTPNRRIDDSSYVIISGLVGMDVCSSCLPDRKECLPNITHVVNMTEYRSLPLKDDRDFNHAQLFQSLQDRNAEGSWEEGSNRLIMKVALGASLEPVRKSTNPLFFLCMNCGTCSFVLFIGSQLISELTESPPHSPPFMLFAYFVILPQICAISVPVQDLLCWSDLEERDGGCFAQQHHHRSL